MMYTPSSSLAANKVAAQLDAVLKGENQTAESAENNSNKLAAKPIPHSKILNCYPGSVVSAL